MGIAEEGVEICRIGEFVMKGEFVAIVEGNGLAQGLRQKGEEAVERGKRGLSGFVGLMQEDSEAGRALVDDEDILAVGLEQHKIGFPVGPVLVPIAVQAITFDLLNGGDKAWGRMPPYWELGWRAAESARSGVFEIGSVGGGFGATTANLRGGLGSASARTGSGHHVGALAVVNAVGTVTIGVRPQFWAGPYEVDAEFGGLGFPTTISADTLDLQMKGGLPPSTTIALVVTDAILTKPQAKRLATMADDGIAKAVRPAHAPMDGDTVFAVSTLARPMTNEQHDLTAIGMAAADCLARAIARGVYEAAAAPAGWAGPPSHREKFPRTSGPQP